MILWVISFGLDIQVNWAFSIHCYRSMSSTLRSKHVAEWKRKKRKRKKKKRIKWKATDKSEILFGKRVKVFTIKVYFFLLIFYLFLLWFRFILFFRKNYFEVVWQNKYFIYVRNLINDAITRIFRCVNKQNEIDFCTSVQTKF